MYYRVYMFMCIKVIYLYPLALQIKKSTPEVVEDVQVQLGDFIVMTSTKYKEKPLIGQVTSTGHNITIDWYIGTYSGTWKPWRGREDGKTVTYRETIDRTDVIQTITFTKGMRLSTKTVKELKAKYTTK